MRRSALALSFVLIASAITPRVSLADGSEEAPEPKKTPNQLKAEQHY